MPIPPHQRAERIAIKRQMALETYNSNRLTMPRRAAARLAGVPMETLYRWQRLFDKGGSRALRPRFTNSGRRSVAKGIHLPAPAVRKLERLLVESRRDEVAWRRFMACRECPAAVRRLPVRSIPAPIARQVKLTVLQTGCKVSADGQRLYITLKKGGRA